MCGGEDVRNASSKMAQQNARYAKGNGSRKNDAAYVLGRVGAFASSLTLWYDDRPKAVVDLINAIPPYTP